MKENVKNVITSPDIKSYCHRYSSPMPDYMNNLAQRTAQEVGHEVMLTGSFLGRFISMLSQMIAPSCILEVGTFTGYGAICLAAGLSEKGKLITIEKDPRLKGFSDREVHAAGKKENIEFLTGDALEIIPTLDHTWDLVFIDAAKRSYIDYYELIMPRLRIGGIIIADNVLWKGLVTSRENDKLGRALDAFNQHVMKDNRVEQVLLPVDDGVNLIRKITHGPNEEK